MPTIKKKAPKKKIQPDEEIRSIAHQVADFYQSRKRVVNIAAAAALAVLLLAGTYFAVQAGKERTATQLLSAAYESYSPAGGAPADHPRALNAFRDISAKYGGTLSGAVARYYAGNVLANMGQLNEALAEYEQALKMRSGGKVLKGLVYQRMGYVYTRLGEQEEAVKAFQQAEQLAGTGAATVELARYYEKAGKSEEAQKKYKEIVEKVPATTWAMEAQTKLPPPVFTPPPASGQTGTAAK